MSRLSFDQFVQRVSAATKLDSQSELARALGINRSAITQARNKNAVPDKWILQLYRAYGINPDWIEYGRGRVFLNPNHEDPASAVVMVPKVQARLCAGNGSFEVGDNVSTYYGFKKEWLSRRGTADRMVLLDVFGNSMSPEIKDGDTILIDQSQQDILAGAVYALGVEDTIMVKRVEKHPNKLVLLSDNREYAPIYLSSPEADAVRIIGKAVWICRELR